MENNEFAAIADIFAVPKPKSSKYYKNEWSSKPLFSCIVCVNPNEGGTDVLSIRLRSLTDHSLIAVAPYDGQHGVNNVADSANHYVFVVRNPSMHAWLGVNFKNPADASEFSLAIQQFMKRRMFTDSAKSGWPVLTERLKHTGEPV